MPGFESARFMGLWGLFHASEAPINGSEPLSLWLQDKSAPYAGDVVTINTLCVGKCFNMMPATALPAPLAGSNGEKYTWLPMGVEYPYFQRPKGVSDLIATLGGDDAALYRIMDPQSPYNAGDRLTGTSGYVSMLQPWKVSGSASEMTDYIIVYRNSRPLHPWSGEAFDLTANNLMRCGLP